MTDAARPSTMTRRGALLTTAAALALGPTALQARQTQQEAMQLAQLAGVDPLPLDLLENLRQALSAVPISASEASNKVQQRILKALYTGVLDSAEEGGTPTRIGFSSALMWGAVEETNNVISYCGGLPGYWSEPPQQS